MIPADNFAPEQLIGKRVAFKDDAEHASCWHSQVGLKTGVVVKIGQTITEKAELMGETYSLPLELLEQQAESPRLWVKVDPTDSFPRGCEASIEIECLVLLDS